MVSPLNRQADRLNNATINKMLDSVISGMHQTS